MSEQQQRSEAFRALHRRDRASSCRTRGTSAPPACWHTWASRRWRRPARAENLLHDRPDLKDTIGRLQAYQEAGADVLYAPGLVRREDIATVVREVDRPVNVLAAVSGFGSSVAELSQIGVKRVSLGSALTRAALGGFVRAARELLERGTFDFLEQAASSREISEAFGAWAGAPR